MRYQVKHNNGYWKLFDTVDYTDRAMFFIKVEADKACAEANGQARGA